MADGIRFLIELDGKTQGATAATGALREVGGAATAAHERLTGASKVEMHGLVGEIFTAELAMEGLKMGAEIAKEGIEKVAEAMVETIKTASEEQRVENVFANMLGPDKGHEMLEFLDQWNIKSEFSEDQTKRFAASLLRAKFSGDDLKNAMAAVGDAASLTIDKMDGAQGMLQSLIRMKMAGTIEKRSIVSMGVSYDELLKQIGELTGKSTAAVKKGITDGTIPFEKEFEAVLRSVEKATGRHLGGAGRDMAKGMEGQLTHLKELPTKMMEGMAHSPGMAELGRAFDDIFDAFAPGKGGADIMTNMSGLFSDIAHEIKGIDWKEVSADAASALAGVREFVEPAKELIHELGSVLHGVIKEFEELAHLGRDAGDWMAELLHPELKQTHAIGVRQVGHHIEQAGMAIPTGYQPHQVSLTDLPATGKADDLAGMFADYQDEQKKEEAKNRIVVPPTISALPSLKLLEGGKTGNVHIEGARADVLVNFHGEKPSTDDVHHAVKRGVEEGLAAAQEKQAAMAGGGR